MKGVKFMDARELFSSLFIFNGLDFDVLDSRFKITDTAVSADYRDGDVILSEGSVTPGLAAISRGCARIVSGESAHPAVLREIREGDTFGAASLFRTSGSFRTLVTASGPCTVMCIPKETVISILSSEPKASLNYIAYLSDRTAFLNRKITAFTQGSADARLAVYLLGLSSDQSRGKLKIEVSLSSLADILGIGRASLYRAMDSLESCGIIARDGKTVTLLDAEKLRQMIQ